MNIQCILCSIFVACILFLPNKLLAQSTSNESDELKHHDKHYHLSGFAGFTSDYKGKNGFKLGIEYEYRINDHVGLGGTFDFTGADFQIFGLSAGATFYPFKFPLIFAAGIGAKYSHEKWKEFYRGVLLYDFHLDNISIGPMVMYDVFSDEKDIISTGITIGFSL